MDNHNKIKFDRTILKVPLFFIFTIWLVYWIEIKFGFNFNKYGLYPKSIEGLRGVLTMHFIHSDTSHLFNNSVPLLVLGSFLFSFYKESAYRVFILGAFLTGLLTWIISDSGYHIGASGIVYLLFSFVFFSGVLKKHFQLVAASLIVIFLYGSMIWYVLPIKEGMSWEGHLSGFIIGIIFAFLFKNKGLKKEKMEFTETEFDLLFDEDGNFNPPENAQELE